MVSNAFASFATGLLGGVSEKSKKKDELDTYYQKKLMDHNSARVLQDARFQEQERLKQKELDAKYGGRDPTQEAIANHIAALTAPQVTPQTVDVAPMALPSDADNSPISPTTPELDTPTPNLAEPISPQLAAADPTLMAGATQPVVLSNEAPQTVSPQVTTPTTPAEAVDPLAPGNLLVPLEKLDPVTRAQVGMLQTTEAKNSAIAYRADRNQDQSKFPEYVTKLAELEQKQGKALPLDPNSFSKDDADYVDTAVKLGVIKDNKSVKPLSDKERLNLEKLVTKAYEARQGAAQGITRLNSVLNLGDDAGNGPLSSTLAKASAAISQMTDSQVNEAVTKLYALDKENIQLTNAAMKSLGNVRPGIGLAQLEKAGQPGSDMPAEARRRVAMESYADYLTLLNHADALIMAPENISASDRIKVAVKHDDSNPALLSDGHTINPEFMTFNDWTRSVREGNKAESRASEVRNPEAAAASGETKPKEDPLGLFK